MRQFIEADERYLCTLPVELRGLMLQVPEAYGGTGRELLFEASLLPL
jgi:hypothetical protein